MESVLTEIRRGLGLTQYQVAALVGVKKGTVSKVEAGKLKPRRKLERWAKTYGRSTEQFSAILEWETDLPLWRFAMKEVRADVEVIECKAKPTTLSA